MKIGVVGTGYVGLVTGACLSEIGHEVTCTDIDEKKIELLNKRVIPIFEPGLDEIVAKNVAAKRLFFTTDLDKTIAENNVIFIAVGTPPRKNGDADLSYVENIARKIAEVAKETKIVVEKSTVPVETGEKVQEVLRQYNPHNIEFDVVSNPEFLREGSAIKDFMEPDRIVIGTGNEMARKIMGEIYAPLKAKIVFTDIKSAELIKHASNSFLAMKISFINAVANVCDKTGANVKEVAFGMGLDKRIGASFLCAGLGYGGSCFPKDVDAFIKMGEKAGCDFSLLKQVQKTNAMQRKLFVKKVEQALWVLKDKKIAVLGLAFKPETDDMRLAPSIDIINELVEEGAIIKAFDPHAMEKAKAFLPASVEFCKSEFDALKGADALLLVTEWKQFLGLDFKKIKSLMRSPIVVDGRNAFDRKELEKLGFKYFGMGV